MKSTSIHESDIEALTKLITNFRDKRNWKQFHNPKDMALSLSLEASELLEHFQWKNPEESLTHTKKNKNDVANELADVFYWVLLISNDLNIDIKKALQKKLKLNAQKYPITKSKNNPKKYTEI